MRLRKIYEITVIIVSENNTVNHLHLSNKEVCTLKSSMYMYTEMLVL